MSADDFEFGARVRTKKPEREAEDWTDEAKASRRWNVNGTVLRADTGHGLYYDVLHDDDGSCGAYEPRELERIDGETRLEMVRHILAASDEGLVTEDEALHRILAALIAPFVARAASGEENGTGAPYCGRAAFRPRRAVVEVGVSRIWFSPCEPTARKGGA